MKAHKAAWAVLTACGVCVTPIRAGEIHDAARAGDVTRVKTMVAADPGLLNARNDQGRTALHLAAYLGHREVVELLLTEGAERDVRDRHGRRPIDAADTRGRREIVDLLVEENVIPLAGNVHRIVSSYGLRPNVGVSAGPDGILLVDTGQERMAERLKAAVLHLGRGTPKYIINTHTHHDHVGGNVLLGEGATIINHDNLEEHRAAGVLSAGSGPLKGKSGREFETYYSMRFNGEEVRLIPAPHAHSPADLLIHFTGSGVVHMGDLLLTQSFPAVGERVKAYLEILDTVIDVFPPHTRFIPGHGRDCTLDEVKQYRATLADTIAVVREQIAAGKSVAQMRRADVLKKWESWGEFLSFLDTDYWIEAVYESYAPPEVPSIAPPAPTETAWPMFRGNPALTGVAASDLPDKLAVRWKFEAPDAITSTAAIADNVVFVGCFDEKLYALNLADGSLKWKYQAKGPVQSSPLVIGSLVVFGDDEGVIHALERADGRLKWTFATEGQVISSPNYEAGRIVVGSYDASLYCLDVDSGAQIWKYETEGYVHGTPSIAQGHVFAVGCDELLHVVSLADGKARATVRIGSPSGSSAAIRGGRAFVGTYGGKVLGIDWDTRKVAWTFEDPDRDFPFMACAAVTSKAVITGGRDKRIRALDAETGKVLWTFVTQARVDSSPVVVGGRAFVGSSDGNLYALDLESGRELWRFEAGAPITASPAVADRCLVIGTDDGVLYCFGSPRSSEP